MISFQDLPEAREYSSEEFDTADERYRVAREKLLQNPRSAQAAKELGGQISARVLHKRGSLAQVRQAVGLTQKQLADTLDMDQGEISRLEHRENVHLTTLSRFIEATGGRLRLVAVYDNVEVDLEISEVAPAGELQER